MNEKDKFIHDTSNILWFLYGAREENDWHMGIKGVDAFSSACRLLGIDEQAFIDMVNKTRT
jgi:hypothetical protein